MEVTILKHSVVFAGLMEKHMAQSFPRLLLGYWPMSSTDWEIDPTGKRSLGLWAWLMDHAQPKYSKPPVPFKMEQSGLIFFLIFF